jgi:hypothetical protein
MMRPEVISEGKDRDFPEVAVTPQPTQNTNFPILFIALFDSSN